MFGATTTSDQAEQGVQKTLPAEYHLQSSKVIKMLLFPNVSKLSKFSPNVQCWMCGVGAAAAAGERAAVTRSRQLAAPAHCTQLSTAAAGGGGLLQQLQLGGGGGAYCSSCWGPGASAPTAASHQPTGENIILIPTQ